MTFTVRTTWTNDNPMTIHNRLAAKLGREPTRQEAIDDLCRIMSEATADLAGTGKLKHQRKA